MQRRRVLTTLIAVSLSSATLSVGAFQVAAATPSAPTPVARSVRAQAAEIALARSVWTSAQSGSSATRHAAALPAVTGAPVPKITLKDQVGDALDADGNPSTPASDITGGGLLQNSHATALAVTVKSPRNPTTDSTWLTGNASVVWLLDTNLDGTADHAAAMADDVQGHLIAKVGTTAHPTCNASVKFSAHVGYEVTAAPGCLPRLSAVRLAICMFYGGQPNDPATSVDCAPNVDFSAPIAAQQGDGYWMLGSDGHVYPFGLAAGHSGLVPGAQAMTPRQDGLGYWIVDSAGQVHPRGLATPFPGAAPTVGFGEVVSTIAALPDGTGYWLFTNRGRVFPYGNAKSYGDMSGRPLNGPIVASVATPSGHGYYMVGSDGGIFTFGDARFHGSTGNLHLNKPIVGIAPTPNGKGYWLVASDGGVFAFGAPFRGSMGGTQLNQPVDGLVAYGNGYLMVASDGGIFDFSDKKFLGSLPPAAPSAPIIGIAAFSV